MQLFPEVKAIETFQPRSKGRKASPAEWNRINLVASRDFEAEVVALRTEIFCLPVLHVAVSAFEGLAVMRRYVRIRGFMVFCLFCQLIGIMTPRTDIDFGCDGIGLVISMTRLALHTGLSVSIGTERGCLYGDSRSHSAENDKNGRRESHVVEIRVFFGERLPPAGPIQRKSTGKKSS